jgi:hypothetical protein
MRPTNQLRPTKSNLIKASLQVMQSAYELSKWCLKLLTKSVRSTTQKYPFKKKPNLFRLKNLYSTFVIRW